MSGTFEAVWGNDGDSDVKSFYLPLGCGAIPELYPETSAAEDVTSGWQVLLYSPMLLALVAASSVSRVAEKLCSS